MDKALIVLAVIWIVYLLRLTWQAKQIMERTHRLLDQAERNIASWPADDI